VNEIIALISMSTPAWWPQVADALPIILSLIILEGLLSVDNAMVIAAMVSHLPGKQRVWALRAGLAGAYVFRGLTLLFVSFLIANPWVKTLGAAYLVYIMCKHLGVPDENEKDSKHVGPKAGFWGTVVSVELADLAFSIDNVIAAVALSPKMWVVVTGVFLGIAAMRFVAGFFVKLMEKYPVMGPIAYLLVGYVGLQLFAEQLYHFHTQPIIKFGIILGIIALALVYDRVKLLQRVFGPLVRWLGEGMGNVAELIDWVFKPLVALGGLVKRLFARNKNKPA